MNSTSCHKIKTVAPVPGGEVPLHTPIQLKYLRMPLDKRRANFIDEAFRKELASEGFWPRPVTLEWECSDDCGDEFTVVISTSPEFAEGTCVVHVVNGRRLEVTNLMVATTYYWKVQCGKECSEVSSFVTEDVAPRLLRIPELWNCRDLGGRIGMEGRRVRQNMAIRTGGFTHNAQKVLYSLEELQSIPNFNERLKAMKAATTLLQNFPRKELPYLLDGAWTVFRPPMKAFGDAELELVDALTEIPEEFLGAKAVKMTVNDNYGVAMNDPIANLPAVLMMDFVSPEEGIMPFTCGADWFWYLRLNGVTIYDRRNGNDKPSDKNSYMLFLPVRKGHNLLTVYLGSGLASFVWYCAPVPSGTALEDVIASGLAENESIFSTFCNQGKRDAQGNVLYTKGDLVLNDEGLDYLVNVLKMKSEIDLRGGGECSGLTGSPVGDDVKWFNISSNSYSGMQSNPGRQGFAEVFRIFLDEKNYPIVFHCIGGQDRTGSIAFILNALLGVQEDELFLDWECSAFWNTSLDFRHEAYFDGMVESFRKWPGDTINEKVENYVLSIGFSHKDIRHFRDIMLE